MVKYANKPEIQFKHNLDGKKYLFATNRVAVWILWVFSRIGVGSSEDGVCREKRWLEELLRECCHYWHVCVCVYSPGVLKRSVLLTAGFLFPRGHVEYICLSGACSKNSTQQVWQASQIRCPHTHKYTDIPMEASMHSHKQTFSYGWFGYLLKQDNTG